MPQCPICETNVNRHIEVYLFAFNKQEYKLYHCPNCDLQWWEPLKIIPEIYENEIIDMYIKFHRIQREKLSSYHGYFFKYFTLQMQKHSRLLDIGCGDGIFLKHVKKLGFEVWGIDLDKKSVEIAKKTLDEENIYAMSLEEFYEFIKTKNIRFDVITFFEVLEHQDNPKDFLIKIKGLLKKRGYIAGSVPNRDSIFQILVNQNYNKTDFPPHHFLRFSYKALYNTLELVDFKNIEIYPTNFRFRDLFPIVEKEIFGNLDSLKNRLKEIVIRDKNLAKAISVEEISKIEEVNKLSFLWINTLKLFRNMILLPFTLKYIRKLRGNGSSFYFQAQI